MDVLSRYLTKYPFCDQLIHVEPRKDLEIIVAIPSYNEPHLKRAIEALLNCQRPDCAVEVIVLINYSNDLSAKKRKELLASSHDFQSWAKSKCEDDFMIFTLIKELPAKSAGVGLARKIAMDEAIRRFAHINQKGIISCFDADCICDPDYLTSIHSLFSLYPDCPGCSIYFEHDTDASKSNQAIIEYELFLRYYIHGLRFAGYPFSYHTVGSSMAVRADAYCKQGGMNRRKAGEDFYFLHKIMPMGKYQSLNTTRVIPSSRISRRVPFGTGKAMADWVDKEFTFWPAYDPMVFKQLADFNSRINSFFQATLSHKDLKVIFNSPLSEFLENEKFIDQMKRINLGTTTLKSFRKAFFRWFDGLKVLKLVHHLSEKVYPKIPVIDAAVNLCKMLRIKPSNNALELLKIFRGLDRSD